MNVKKELMNVFFPCNKYIQMRFSDDGSHMRGRVAYRKILGIPLMYVSRLLDFDTGEYFETRQSGDRFYAEIRRINK